MVEHLEEHDERLRIERRAASEPVAAEGDPVIFHWVVYERVATGASEDGATRGKHPGIRDANDQPIETTEPYVWVISFTGPENEARMHFDSLKTKAETGL